ncbi:MAG TPA: hypothetical protein VLC06_14955 [Polyangia bacterium]|jgi:hypothetical protein|nr:hypothetical protein [Polyangia bacterium]
MTAVRIGSPGSNRPSFYRKWVSCAPRLNPPAKTSSRTPSGLEAGETSVCHIRGTLANGGRVTAAVTYAPVTINCCPGFNITLGQFTPLDAGVDGVAR